MITITVNGEPKRYPDAPQVAEVVAEVAASPKGIAVAVNADVVVRSAWTTTRLADGDQVEVLTAAQGG